MPAGEEGLIMPVNMNAEEFENRLAKLAGLCLKVGVNLQHGQELIVTAPIEASAFVHHIAKIAYQQGAKLVTCLYEDPAMIHDRFAYADDDTLDYAPEWVYRGMSGAFENGAARLYVVGPYPDLLSGISAEKIVRTHTSMATASEVETRFTSESRINWSTVPFVTNSWAKTVFPDLPADKASLQLWRHVFDATRINCPDPVHAWAEHNRLLDTRRNFLQSRKFVALHFYDGRTDLRIGLVDGHRWVGGTVVAANGVEGICNIPTEEIFTCPHKDRTNGRVFFSKPLALAGTIVDNLCVEFRDGMVVSVKAGKGQEMFEKLIACDAGARRLGEVGLVPNSSPISRSGILFYNALFDENAASHLAFGQSYAACLAADSRSANTPEEAGANQSSIHIDCMLGNASMNVDGISGTGRAEPVMRGGEFVI
jgi:aminopeptidase